MEYKYGVEYHCNGVNPDLPDDMLVCIDGGKHGVGTADSWLWEITESFRIVDERYKPENWHKDGKTPSAGTECEYTIGDNFGGYKQCCFVGFNSRGSLVIELLDGELKSFHKHQIKFRPIRTDREKFIEAAMRAAGDYHKLEDALGNLFDAGFKAPEATK